jgi:hypothetical protein
MVVIQVKVGKFFIDNVLIDGGFGVNIIIQNLKVQLSLSKPNPSPYNLLMENQTIVELLGFIRDLKNSFMVFPTQLHLLLSTSLF